MKRFKEFFSPVVGGNYDGYTFKQFMWAWQRIGLVLLAAGFVTVIALLKDTFPTDEPGFIIGISFTSLILAIVLYKGIYQHWSDMKNNTSR